MVTLVTWLHLRFRKAAIITDIKRWLDRIFTVDEEMQSIAEAKQTAFEAATKITAANNFDKVFSGSSARNDKALVNFAQMSADYDKALEELSWVKKEISAALLWLLEGESRAVLVAYYLNRKDFPRIAADFGVTTRQIRNIFHAAIEKLRPLISESGMWRYNVPELRAELLSKNGKGWSG